MSTWDNKAISGKDLQEKVVQELASEIKKRGLSEVIAEALVGMAARIESLEAALAERNIGDRTADSVDAQTLKVGGVDVTDASNHTANFSQASSRVNLSAGEKLSVMFGKIAKWFGDLKTVAFTGSYNDLSNKPTIPSAVTVDQTYNASSTNPQSGTAVAGAIANKQNRLTRVELTQTLNDISTDPFVLSFATLNVLNRLGNSGNNVFVTYKVGELTEEHRWEVSRAEIKVPYALSDSKNDELHVLLDLTDAARTYPIIEASNLLSVYVLDSGGNNLYQEDGSTLQVDCRFGKKYIFHITGSTYTVRPIDSKYYAKTMATGAVNTNAWDTIGASTVDYKLCDWGSTISQFFPAFLGGNVNILYGYQFTLVYTLSIIIENNSSADINVAFNLGRLNLDTSQTRPVLFGCGQYAIVPANSKKYIDLSATDILARADFANTYGPLNFYMTIDGRSWTATDRVYVGKGHARLIVDWMDPS